MPRTFEWRTLWPGLAVAGALVLAIAWVLVYARVGAVRGDTYRLFAATSEARGVLKGTEVWLAGQRVGAVARIEFRPVASDTLRRLLLQLEILERHRSLIRRDSHVDLRPGGKLLGQPVVFIVPGTPAAPALEPGDTLTAPPQGDAESLASELARLGRAFPDIRRNAVMIREQLMQVSGVARLEDEPAGIELDILRTRVERLSRAAKADGTLGRLLRPRRDGDHARGPRLHSLAARADTLAELLSRRNTTIDRVRNDTTLSRHASALLAEVARLRALIESPDGTIGRAILDDAIRLELGELERELDALLRDMARRPWRYVHF